MVSFSYAVRTCASWINMRCFMGVRRARNFGGLSCLTSILSNVLFFADSAFFPAWIDSSPYSVQPLRPWR